MCRRPGHSRGPGQTDAATGATRQGTPAKDRAYANRPDQTKLNPRLRTKPCEQSRRFKNHRDRRARAGWLTNKTPNDCPTFVLAILILLFLVLLIQFLILIFILIF